MKEEKIRWGKSIVQSLYPIPVGVGFALDRRLRSKSIAPATLKDTYNFWSLSVYP